MKPVRFITALIAVIGVVITAVLVFTTVYTGRQESQSAVHTAARHVIGNLAAPITLTIFTDYECPHCKDFHERSYGKLHAAYGGGIVVIYKNFPREEHTGAYLKAQIAECIARIDGEETYWKYVSRLFKVDQPVATSQSDNAGYAAAEAVGIAVAPVRTCVASGVAKKIVDDDIAEGKGAGVDATPGVVIEGAGKSILVQGNRGNGTRVAIDYIQSLIHRVDTLK